MVINWLYIILCWWMPKTWQERIWNMLPDRCDVFMCSRKGIRGNENLVDGKFICDYCIVQGMRDWCRARGIIRDDEDHPENAAR